MSAGRPLDRLRTATGGHADDVLVFFDAEHRWCGRTDAAGASGAEAKASGAAISVAALAPAAARRWRRFLRWVRWPGLVPTAGGPATRGQSSTATGASAADDLLAAAAPRDATGAGAPAIDSGAADGATAGHRFPTTGRNAALEENPSTCVHYRMETDAPQVDHTIPRSRGGDATTANTHTTCGRLNASKGARDFPVAPPSGYRGPWPPPWWDTGG